MSNNFLTYKGYTGSAQVSVADGVLHGRLLYVHDLVAYEANSIDGLRDAFQAAVDDYLQTCEEVGKTPVKPHSDLDQPKPVVEVFCGPTLAGQHRLVAALRDLDGAFGRAVRAARTAGEKKIFAELEAQWSSHEAFVHPLLSAQPALLLK